QHQDDAAKAEKDHEKAKATDEKAIQTTNENDAQANEIKGVAAESSNTASKTEADGNSEIQKSTALKQSLVSEQKDMEAKLAARIAPFRPLRTRVEIPPEIE